MGGAPAPAGRGAALRRGPVGRRGLAVLLAGLALAAALTAADLVWSPTRSTSSSSDSPVRALVLTGSALERDGTSLAYGAGRALGWDVDVRLVPGAGWARAVGGGRPLVDALRGTLDLSQYDVVVLQAGEADVAAPEAEVRNGLLHTVDVVQAAAPQARVVLVGPLRDGVVAGPPLRQVQAVVASVEQERSRVSVVDALARGWRAGEPGLRERLDDVLADLPTSVTTAG